MRTNVRGNGGVGISRIRYAAVDGVLRQQIGEHLAEQAAAAAGVEPDSGTAFAWELGQSLGSLPDGDMHPCEGRPEAYLLAGDMLFRIEGRLTGSPARGEVEVEGKPLKGKWDVLLASRYDPEVDAFGRGFRTKWTFTYEGSPFAAIAGIRRVETDRSWWSNDADRYARKLAAAVGWPLEAAD